MRTRWRQGLLMLAGALVLALAFYGYLQPSFILDLANRLILCL
ncbi:MAG: hypothetical protein RL717_447 [Pseudomonadota bacterium]